MSDIIRVDLTPEEAEIVIDAILFSRHVRRRDVLAKIFKAQSNPLTGIPLPLCVPGGINERDAAIDEEDDARQDEEQEAFEKAIDAEDVIPDDEIPW